MLRVWLAIWLIVSGGVYGDTLTLGDGDRYSLPTRLTYYQDLSSDLSIEDILALPKDQWRASNQTNTSFGYSSGAYWFFVDLHVEQADLWYLWLRYPPHDDVQLYWVKDGRVVDFVYTGDRFPFHVRQVSTPDYAFSRWLEQGEQIRFYLRIKTEGSYRIPLQIWRKKAFEQERSEQLVFQGVYYGVLFVMTIYNLVLFFITRIYSYLHYVFYVAMSLGSRLALDGTGFQFFWSNAPAFNQWAIPIFFWLSSVSYWVFSYSFLNFQKATLPIKTYFVGMGLFIAALGFPMAILPYHSYVPLISVVAMVLMFSSLVSSIYLTFKGQPYAGVFAVATMMTALAFGFSVFESLGAYDNQTLMIYSYPIARMFEVVLFAIALGVRIRFLQMRRMEAEKEAVNLKEQAVKNLRQYERLYENALTGNFIVNLTGTITKANSAFKSLLGITSNDEQSLSCYLNDDIQGRLKAAQASHTALQFDCQTKNQRWVSVMLNPVTIKDDLVYEGSAIDITDRIHANSLKQKSEQDKMSALQQLVVGVAHEINTPLGVVRTSSDFAKEVFKEIKVGIEKGSLAKQDCLSRLQGAEDALNLTDEGLLRMAQLIQSFKQASVEQMQFHLDEWQLSQWLSQVKGHANKRGVDIQVQSEQCPDSFMTYGDALQWVMHELIDNAVDYNEGPWKVEITLTCSQEHCHIHFCDNGRGIDPQYLPHLFEPFFTTRRGAEQKLGLGLYQVHNIITQLMHGAIVANNKNGLNYELTFPNLAKTLTGERSESTAKH